MRKNIIYFLERIRIKNAILLARAIFLNAIFRLLPETYGIKKYNKMQRAIYTKMIGDMEITKNKCVGAFEEHERYPYENYLLMNYHGKYGVALDFGCGMGRMIKRMYNYFEYVDGGDLMRENLNLARVYLGDESHQRTELFELDGIGCNIEVDKKYDFIYSTICMQHIAIHSIRKKIIQDMYGLLRPNGAISLQVGFGWDNGVHWFDNEYAARSTNAGLDVSIPSIEHLDRIKNELSNLGYENIKFERRPSPHPHLKEYHIEWLFIYAEKLNTELSDLPVEVKL